MSSVRTVCGLRRGRHRAAVPLSAAAADEPDAAVQLEQVKSQLAELRQSYEARLQALEKRIAELQGAAARSPRAAAATVGASPRPPPPPRPPLPLPRRRWLQRPPAASATAFNPAISLILAGTYANLSRDPDTYRCRASCRPAARSARESRGFSLGESELGSAPTSTRCSPASLTRRSPPTTGSSVEEA